MHSTSSRLDFRLDSECKDFSSLTEGIRCRIYYLRAEEDASIWHEQMGYPEQKPPYDLHRMAIDVRNGVVFLYAYPGSRTSILLKSYNRLRLISRQANADMLPFLCSRYYILLHGTALSRVDLLTSLDLTTRFRRLIIAFDHASCQEYGCPHYDNWYHDENRRLNDHIRYAEHENDFSTALSGWQDLASSRLQLAVDIDIGLCYSATDVQKAAMIVAPLDQMSLRKCFLRFGKRWARTVHADLARQAFKSLRQQDHIQHFFRFFDLPVEIRHAILKHTDLVSPLRQVHWNAGKKFELHIRKRMDLRPHLRLCSWTLFCGNNSYNTYPLCSCFVTPTPLFLVSRAMKEDAETVFFGDNRFITGAPGWSDESDGPRYTNYNEATSFFMDAVSQTCLSLLRDVELAFTFWSYAHLDEDVNALRQWNRCITLLAPHMRNLRLTLQLGWPRIDYHDRASLGPTYLRIRRRQLFGIYRELVVPLRQWREHLRSFSVVIHDMTGDHHDFWIERKDEREMHSFEERAQERELEKLVMGEDYDSIAHGKLRRCKSRWDREREPDGWDIKYWDPAL